MAEIIWSPQAREDLQNIYNYIAGDSEKYASILVEQIIQHTMMLKDLPKAGKKVPEINLEEIREIIYQNYRIVYHLRDEKEISILTVHHGARLFNIDV